MKTIISLTSIPSRFEHVETTLLSLLKQDKKADKIILYIPRYYKRFKKKVIRAPKVPKGVEVRFSDIDYGPSTKILPAVKDFFNDDVRIILFVKLKDKMMLSDKLIQSIKLKIKESCSPRHVPSIIKD